jgi:hypothetical protein
VTIDQRGERPIITFQSAAHQESIRHAGRYTSARRSGVTGIRAKGRRDRHRMTNTPALPPKSSLTSVSPGGADHAPPSSLRLTR